ncbi:MAG TPA: flagellar hook-basal body protein [Proteobacteria bacterium]|nr:flagellar hook-basal body protein [Pseudomonadota bacterium]
MNHEMYSALSGALSNERRQEIIANNLANVSSGGFRRDVPLFATVYDRISGPAVLPSGRETLEYNSFAVYDGSWIDFQTGNMLETGSSLDVALDGEGFFAFKRASDGKIYYGRDGHFRLNEKQELVAMNGDQVLAAGEGDEPLVVAKENFQPGDLKFGKLGDLVLAGEPIGALRLVTFANLQCLEKLGDCGFLETSFSGEPLPADKLVVRQGVRELSNVNLIEEMVSMIEVARQYENQQKIIISLDEINKLAAKGIVAA